jgi:predicted GNAT superfamily acetyltransferase
MILIRPCAGIDELQACVDIQVETWGYDQTDVIPSRAFLVAQKIGGQVIGAFDTDISGTSAEGEPASLVAFAFAWPGFKSGAPSDRSRSHESKIGKGEPRPYLHSHMLAVKAGYRNRGLGAKLKREQRIEALSRGIRHMEWTFDPLEIKNAYLNIHKLGAIVRDYRVNFYGVSSSRLQAGLPTDRLVAEWELGSPRVEAFLEGQPAVAEVIEERIMVPSAIYEWKASEADRERAEAVLIENRGRFLKAFSRGLAVVGFVRDTEGNGVFELGSLI